MTEPEYEVYVEVFTILEWRDGAVYRTKRGGPRWMSKATVDANLPGVTNIIYGAATDEFAQNNSIIRRKRT